MEVLFTYIHLVADDQNNEMFTNKSRKELEGTLITVRQNIEFWKRKEEAILELLSTNPEPTVIADQRPSPGRWGSVRKNVYEATIALIRAKQEPVQASEIVDYMEKRNVSLGKSENPEKNVLSHLNAIISSWSECIIERVNRGHYHFKEELREQLLSEN